VVTPVRVSECGTTWGRAWVGGIQGAGGVRRLAASPGRRGRFFAVRYAAYASRASFSILCTRQKSFHCPSTLRRPRSVNRVRPLL